MFPPLAVTQSLHQGKQRERPRSRLEALRYPRTHTFLFSITSGRVIYAFPASKTLLIISLEYPNITLNANLPVLNVGNRENPSYLPAEVCIVLPGQTIKRRLSPDQTQQMITFACRKPWGNAESVVGDGKQVLGLNQSSNAISVSSSDFKHDAL